MTIFNDTLGAYHIQESSFQKSCYDYAIYAHHFIKGSTVSENKFTNKKDARELWVEINRLVEEDRKKNKEQIRRD